MFKINIVLIGLLILVSGCEFPRSADGQYMIYEKSISNNKKYRIESRIYPNDEPEIYIIDQDKNEEERLTDNEFIEFNPVINNKKDYAYALSEYENDSSTIILNGKPIEYTKNKLLFKNLAINDSYLAFHESRFYDNKNFLNIYDLRGKKISRTFIDDYIQKIAFLDDYTLVLQIFSLSTNSMDIALFDIRNSKLNYLLNTENDELLSKVEYKDSFYVEVIENKPNELKLLFNAMYHYRNFQYKEPFSLGNDFMGRLAWNQSYRLEALTKLYLITKDEEILINIDNTISNILQRVNEEQNINDPFNHKFSYATKKYSIDKNHLISFMVNDGKIYYAMMYAINSIGGVLKSKYLEILTNRLSELYDYYNNYYADGLYYFQKGMSFWADGIWLPWNMQNAFALAMLEVYKATKDQKYKSRLFEMANKFKKELVYDNEKLIWHYFPNKFYEGWDIEDNLSINTPSMKPSEDKLYEDLGHAGINVKFILEFYDTFPKEVFTTSDIQKLHKTIDNFIYEKTFSRFISGDVEYQKPEYRFIPGYGWSELNNIKLKSFYYPLNPIFYPDFDNQDWIKYVNSINSKDIDNSNLDIKLIKYNNKFEIENMKTNKYNVNKLLRYF